MSLAKFKIRGIPLDEASVPQEGTVIIDRVASLITVKPFRKRKEYTLPLAEVAQRIVRSIILAEAREKAKAKAEKKKLTRDFRNARRRIRGR